MNRSDPDAFGRLLAFAQSAAGNLKVRSALNPLLWLCAIVTIPCLGLAALLSEKLIIAVPLLIIAFLPVVSAIGAYIYFMITSPNKLQSEEYQIKQQALELVQSKGSPIEIMPLSLDSMTNPAPIRAIEGGRQ